MCLVNQEACGHAEEGSATCRGMPRENAPTSRLLHPQKPACAPDQHPSTRQSQFVHLFIQKWPQAPNQLPSGRPATVGTVAAFSASSAVQCVPTLTLTPLSRCSMLWPVPELPTQHAHTALQRRASTAPSSHRGRRNDMMCSSILTFLLCRASASHFAVSVRKRMPLSLIHI